MSSDEPQTFRFVFHRGMVQEYRGWDRRQAVKDITTLRDRYYGAIRASQKIKLQRADEATVEFSMSDTRLSEKEDAYKECEAIAQDYFQCKGAREAAMARRA